MADNGASGFVKGIMAGMPYGQMLGDAIARRRSANRMEDVQDQIDSGALDPSTADGQQQIAIAARQAQQPMSQRGLDDSYGDQQYDRLRGQSIMRSAQQGGQQINDGDMSGGLDTQARGLLSAGNVAQGVQGMGFAGQVRAGENSIDANGNVNNEQLAHGTAQNAAMMGDSAGAHQWSDQQKTDHNAVINNLAGRIMQTASGPGGMQQAAGLVDSLAKMTGMGDTQYSPADGGTIQVLGADGSVNMSINKQNLADFATHAAQNPDNIVGAYQSFISANAKQQADTRQEVFKQGAQAAYKVATSDFPNPMAAEMKSQSAQLAGQAKAAGWDIDTGTKQPKVDASGAPVEGVTTYIVKSPHGGEPLTMEVDTTGPKPTTRLFTAEGQPVPPQFLAQQGVGVQLAARAAQLDAYSDAHQAGMQNRAQQFKDIDQVSRGLMGAIGGSGQPGTTGGDPMNGPAVPLPKRATAPVSAMGAGQAKGATPPLKTMIQQVPYKSPFAALNEAQFMQESSGDNNAVSKKGAYGVAQLMPATAKELEEHFGLPAGASKDPHVNIELGMRYRDALINNYMKQGHGQQQAVALGLAAYDAGPGRVQDFLDGKKDLPAETRNYVSGILGRVGGGQQADVAQAQPQQPAPQQAQPAAINVGGRQLVNPFAAVS